MSDQRTRRNGTSGRSDRSPKGISSPAAADGSTVCGFARSLRAFSAFARFEDAARELEALEPRAEELATVLILAVERLERHHLKRYAEIVAEHDWRVAA